MPFEALWAFDDAPSVFTDAQAAAWFAAQGARTRAIEGRWWAERTFGQGGHRGYWEPVDRVAPVSGARRRWPSHSALGFRAACPPEEATGRSFVSMVASMASFDASRLSRDRRRLVRRAQRTFTFRRLTTPDVLLRAGWAVALDSAARTGQRRERTQMSYEAVVRARYGRDSGLVIGAFDDSGLVGYAQSFAVRRTAYFTSLCLAAPALRGSAGDALYWLTLSSWALAADVETVSLGLQLGERPGIEPYKRTFGAETLGVPIVSRLRAPVALVLRATRPASFDRLMGVA